MPAGASQAIKQNISKSKIQRIAKPKTIRVTDQDATAIRGGTGPTKQGSDVRLPQPAPSGGS